MTNTPRNRPSGSAEWFIGLVEHESGFWPWIDGESELDRKSANKFLLGCLLDFQIKAERAWENARRLSEDYLGDPDDIWSSISSSMIGMGITLKHMFLIRKGNVTLQYPEEKWPRPDRNIGFEHEDYNVIRSRLHVDMDDCIGCLKCARACPVDCIKIDTIKVPKGSDIGTTSNDTKK